MADNSTPNSKTRDSNLFNSVSRFIMIGFGVFIGTSVINGNMSILSALGLTLVVAIVFAYFSQVLETKSNN